MSLNSTISVTNPVLSDSPKAVSDIHIFNKDCKECMVTLPYKPCVSEMSFKK